MPLRVAGQPVEIAITPIDQIVRISVVPLENGRPRPIPDDGSLVQQDWGPPAIRLTDRGQTEAAPRGPGWKLTVTAEPLTVRIEAADGRLIQQIRVDARTGHFTFHLGDGPVLGFGEGGPQFDRRGLVRPDAERPGRIPAADARRPRPDPLADRNRPAGPCSSTSRPAPST